MALDQPVNEAASMPSSSSVPLGSSGSGMVFNHALCIRRVREAYASTIPKNNEEASKKSGHKASIVMASGVKSGGDGGSSPIVGAVLHRIAELEAQKRSDEEQQRWMENDRNHKRLAQEEAFRVAGETQRELMSDPVAELEAKRRADRILMLQCLADFGLDPASMNSNRLAAEILIGKETETCGFCGSKTDRECSKCDIEYFCNEECEKMSVIHPPKDQTSVERLRVAAKRGDSPEKLRKDTGLCSDWGFSGLAGDNNWNLLLAIYRDVFEKARITVSGLEEMRMSGHLQDKVLETLHGVPEEDRGSNLACFDAGIRNGTMYIGEMGLQSYWLYEASNFLEPEDKVKQLTEVKPPAKRQAWRLLSSLIFPRLPDPENDLLDFGDDPFHRFGFVVCKNTDEQRAMVGMYRELLLGLKYHQKFAERSISPGDETETICTFRAFWEAHQDKKLVELIEQKRHDFDLAPGLWLLLQDFLRVPKGAKEPSVYALLHFLCCPGLMVAKGEMQREFGFRSTEADADHTFEGQRMYCRVLEKITPARLQKLIDEGIVKRCGGSWDELEAALNKRLGEVISEEDGDSDEEGEQARPTAECAESKSQLEIAKVEEHSELSSTDGGANAIPATTTKAGSPTATSTSHDAASPTAASDKAASPTANSTLRNAASDKAASPTAISTSHDAASPTATSTSRNAASLEAVANTTKVAKGAMISRTPPAGASGTTSDSELPKTQPVGASQCTSSDSKALSPTEPASEMPVQTATKPEPTEPKGPTKAQRKRAGRKALRAAELAAKPVEAEEEEFADEVDELQLATAFSKAKAGILPKTKAESKEQTKFVRQSHAELGAVVKTKSKKLVGENKVPATPTNTQSHLAKPPTKAGTKVAAPNNTKKAIPSEAVPAAAETPKAVEEQSAPVVNLAAADNVHEWPVLEPKGNTSPSGPISPPCTSVALPPKPAVKPIKAAEKPSEKSKAAEVAKTKGVKKVEPKEVGMTPAVRPPIASQPAKPTANGKAKNTAQTPAAVSSVITKPIEKAKPKQVGKTAAAQPSSTPQPAKPVANSGKAKQPVQTSAAVPSVVGKPVGPVKPKAVAKPQVALPSIASQPAKPATKGKGKETAKVAAAAPSVVAKPAQKVVSKEVAKTSVAQSSAVPETKKPVIPAGKGKEVPSAPPSLPQPAATTSVVSKDNKDTPVEPVPRVSLPPSTVPKEVKQVKEVVARIVQSAPKRPVTPPIATKVNEEAAPIIQSAPKRPTAPPVVTLPPSTASKEVKEAKEVVVPIIQSAPKRPMTPPVVCSSTVWSPEVPVAVVNEPKIKEVAPTAQPPKVYVTSPTVSEVSEIPSVSDSVHKRSSSLPADLKINEVIPTTDLFPKETVASAVVPEIKEDASVGQNTSEMPATQQTVEDASVDRSASEQPATQPLNADIVAVLLQHLADEGISTFAVIPALLARLEVETKSDKKDLASTKEALARANAEVAELTTKLSNVETKLAGTESKLAIMSGAYDDNSIELRRVTDIALGADEEIDSHVKEANEKIANMKERMGLAEARKEYYKNRSFYLEKLLDDCWGVGWEEKWEREKAEEQARETQDDDHNMPESYPVQQMDQSTSRGPYSQPPQFEPAGYQPNVPIQGDYNYGGMDMRRVPGPPMPGYPNGYPLPALPPPPPQGFYGLPMNTAPNHGGHWDLHGGFGTVQTHVRGVDLQYGPLDALAPAFVSNNSYDPNSPMNYDPRVSGPYYPQYAGQHEQRGSGSIDHSHPAPPRSSNQNGNNRQERGVWFPRQDAYHGGDHGHDGGRNEGQRARPEPVYHNNGGSQHAGGQKSGGGQKGGGGQKSGGGQKHNGPNQGGGGQKHGGSNQGGSKGGSKGGSNKGQSQKATSN